jgi:hypothetical protein
MLNRIDRNMAFFAVRMVSYHRSSRGGIRCRNSWRQLYRGMRVVVSCCSVRHGTKCSSKQGRLVCVNKHRSALGAVSVSPPLYLVLPNPMPKQREASGDALPAARTTQQSDIPYFSRNIRERPCPLLVYFTVQPCGGRYVTHGRLNYAAYSPISG